MVHIAIIMIITKNTVIKYVTKRLPDAQWSNKKYFNSGDIPGGTVVKIMLFQCRGYGFDPWSVN